MQGINMRACSCELATEFQLDRRPQILLRCDTVMGNNYYHTENECSIEIRKTTLCSLTGVRIPLVQLIQIANNAFTNLNNEYHQRKQKANLG